MKVCRFRVSATRPRVGVLAPDDQGIIDLTAAGFESVSALLDAPDPIATIQKTIGTRTADFTPDEVTFCAPVDQHEVWAAGVTYLRSKTARMAESDFSATAYDRVYAAPRPELFFKSIAEKVVATEDTVGIRRDARWNVPEPELALVFNSRGQVVGYTVGNDMSSRDIEGENLLYLPQAKIYDRSCALGPWIHLGASEETARTWKVTIAIRRDDRAVFTGDTTLSRLKRSFAELGEHLFRSQRFPHGVVLLTGTGIVPDDTFTLAAGDRIEITISGIGTLRNTVAVV